MNGPDEDFTIFEDYDLRAPQPKQLYFGRLVGQSDRDAVPFFDLKKRSYISTTSMDSELALVTANLTLARPNTIFFDPFTGTGSFEIACAHFGAMVMGSDIDGRSVRGRKGRSVKGNFQQYGLTSWHLDDIVSDLTNTPLRSCRLFEGIVCDPPYGVREGLKVLGAKEGREREAMIIDGEWAH